MSCLLGNGCTRIGLEIENISHPLRDMLVLLSDLMNNSWGDFWLGILLWDWRNNGWDGLLGMMQLYNDQVAFLIDQLRADLVPVPV